MASEKKRRSVFERIKTAPRDDPATFRLIVGLAAAHMVFAFVLYLTF